MEADRPRGPCRLPGGRRGAVLGAILAAVALGAGPAWASQRPIAVPSSAPVGTGSSDGVHPGAIVQSDIGQCTMNFMFAGSDGARYIATAGHCILGSSDPTSDLSAAPPAEKTWPAGSGPVALDSNGRRIGTFAYAILEDPKDFALIRLDASVSASPAVEYFGGPVGIDGDLSTQTVVLEYFGNGVGAGNVVPGRSAIAFGTPNPDHVYAEGLVTPGDSGAPIETSDGRAVGVVVTTGVSLGTLGTGGVDGGVMGVTRLGPQIARAQHMMGVGLALQTASPTGVAVPSSSGSAGGSGPGSSGVGSRGGSAKGSAPASKRSRRPGQRRRRVSPKHRHRGRARHRRTRRAGQHRRGSRRSSRRR